MDKSKVGGQKLQVIDLTEDTFDFAAGKFTIAGFTDKNGKQWFSAKIACGNLGLRNISQAVSSLPYKDKAIITISDNGIPVRHLMVTRSGLFRLIFKSQTDFAEEYQDWVFDEVLPAIHEQGGYISSGATSEQVIRLQQQINSLVSLNDGLHEQLADADVELTNLKRLTNTQQKAIHRYTDAEYDYLDNEEI